MTVYLDLLILDNFCADASLLYCAVRTVKGKAYWWRIALSALLGTALGVGYTVFCLYYTLPRAVDYIIRYGVALLLPVTAASFQKPKTYFLCSLIFLAYMAAFAGILTSLCGIRFDENGENLEYLMQGIPSGILVGGCVLFAFLGVRIAKKLTKHTKVLSQTLECVLVYGEKSVSVQAFADTGNRLRDRMGNPVAVAQRSAVLPLFSDFGARPQFEKIVVHTVGGQSELFAFRVDELQIYSERKVHTIKGIKVAFGDWKSAGEYGLILPPEFAKEEYFSGAEVKKC